jgi:hypothetical protein
MIPFSILTILLTLTVAIFVSPGQQTLISFLVVVQIDLPIVAEFLLACSQLLKDLRRGVDLGAESCLNQKVQSMARAELVCPKNQWKLFVSLTIFV